MSNELQHYGTKHHSGRYKWGSGKENGGPLNSVTNVFKEAKVKQEKKREYADQQIKLSAERIYKKMYENNPPPEKNPQQPRQYAQRIDQPKQKTRYTHDLNKTKRVVDASSTLAGALKKMNDADVAVSRKKMNLNNMTDQQLRERINRYNLEKTYNEMFSPTNISEGRKTATDFLNATTTILTVGASALGLALAVKELKQK